jgi:hypothetical protein
MASRYIISGSTPGYGAPHYLLLISEADATRLKEHASSIEFPSSKGTEIEYILFRYPLRISIIVFSRRQSWHQEMRSLLGDTITDAIGASIKGEGIERIHAVLDLDELSQEDRARFDKALSDYRKYKYDYWFYVNSGGGVGVLYKDDDLYEPYCTFLPITTLR